MRKMRSFSMKDNIVYGGYDIMDNRHRQTDLYNSQIGMFKDFKLEKL